MKKRIISACLVAIVVALICGYCYYENTNEKVLLYKKYASQLEECQDMINQTNYCYEEETSQAKDARNKDLAKVDKYKSLIDDKNFTAEDKKSFSEFCTSVKNKYEEDAIETKNQHDSIFADLLANTDSDYYSKDFISQMQSSDKSYKEKYDEGSYLDAFSIVLDMKSSLLEYTNQRDAEIKAKQEEESQSNTSTSSDSSSTSSESIASSKATFTAIGDSVMLGAKDTLQGVYPNAYIDAQESRQVSAAISIVNSLKANKQLSNKVIVALGTNGNFSTSSGQELIDTIGKKRHIYWVGTCGMAWQDQVNSTIKSLCNANKNVTYVDWASYASGHSDWFYSDGIHLNPSGRTGYAKMIKKYIH